MNVTASLTLFCVLACLVPASTPVLRAGGQTQDRAAVQPPPNPPRQPAVKDSCLTCHRALGDDRLTPPARSFSNDIHRAEGFTCASCHGGDPNADGMEAMDPAKGFIGVPARQRIPDLCGRCHSDPTFMRRYNPKIRTDQVARYRTSVHGMRLAELNDPKVAVCTSCHALHEIRTPDDPRSNIFPLNVAHTCGHCHADPKYMAGYNIPTDQLAQYEQSVHWNALSVKGDRSAATCNDCHGNHGAAPPGISSVQNVCGVCHSSTAELFDASIHGRVFPEIGQPGCVTCHSNHKIVPPTERMLGVGDAAVCATCHGPDDAGGKAAGEMRTLIDRLQQQYEQAQQILQQAAFAGMEVSQAQAGLQDARTALVQARTETHTARVEAVKVETDKGLEVAQKAYADGQNALQQLHVRRTGLALSLIVIAALIVGIVFLIKRIESHAGSGSGGAR
jgi:predicted CXXCH cytochrome family protein